MKVKKIILSITLVAIATLGYGQRTYTIERLFPNQYPEAEYIAAHYSAPDHVDIWNHDKKGRASKKVSWDVFKSPEVYGCFSKFTVFSASFTDNTSPVNLVLNCTFSYACVIIAVGISTC